jgi:acetylornithine deacetylase/succinyl-diaminopimelate desuccinylase-like protein
MALADQIRTFVDSAFAQQTEFLAELVKVPSDNPPGDCAPHAARAHKLLESLGFIVEAHKVPQPAVEAAGMKSVTNLIVRQFFGTGPTIALNAHGDVVPPGLGWSRDPYGATIETGPQGPIMYGRGVAVSKSDFATYTFALLALMFVARTARIGGTVELHFTYDEEAGGELGPKWLLDQGLSNPNFVIGAGFTYNIVNAHNGCLHLEVSVTGRQAHAAMPASGRDALEATNTILAAIYAARPQLLQKTSNVPGITSPTLNVGLIKGGINTNVVPDRVTLRIDRRIIPEESPALVEDDLRNLILSAAKPLAGIEVAVKRVMLAEPFHPRPGWEKIARAIQARAREVLSLDIPVNGVPLYTDARHYAARGIPTVLYGAGPRSLIDANAHNADENLRLNDLRSATRVVALAVADLCMT